MIAYHAIVATLVALLPVFNRAPLEETKFAQLPLGSIKTYGWLQEQLQRQANGLTGNLDDIYPQVMGPTNAWLGGDGDAWERGPYWIDGLLPLAYLLDDDALKAKAITWVNAILDSQQEDGYIGPAQDYPFIYGLQRGGTHDWWPKMVALKILQQYYMASGDQRVIDCLTKYFQYQLKHLPETPLDHWSDWGKARGADNLNIVYWLYNITGEPWLLELGELIHSQTYDWTSAFTDGNIFYNQGSVHCVNLGQGFKAPHVWWQYSHDPKDLEAPKKAVETIRHTVGLPTGLWAGDEMLHWGNPTRGSELCTAVEMMYSLEEMLRITGDPFWADYLERVAFNALPAQIKDDFTAKQYYQQTNQIACTHQTRPFSTPHDGTDTMFGTLNGYPCCLSNMHQGWPKFTQNLWYATNDGGLAAMVYAPSTVTAKVKGDVEVRITEQSNYPFEEALEFKIDFTKKKVKKAAFPLHFRVPGWCEKPQFSINGEAVQPKLAGGIVVIEREWNRGDVIALSFPMEIRTEEWFDKAWSIVRGPLVYALKMDEKWSWKPFEGKDLWYGKGAWEVTSDTPWNYCIMRDSFSTDKCEVSADGIKIPARTLPHWTNIDSVAYWTEDGDDTGEDVVIELIPYGCTTLRIAEFPTRIEPWDRSYRETPPDPVPAKTPLICAHRGFWKCDEAGKAQNSIASLSLAQQNGFWGSEFDVHLTADSVAVVNHDPSIGGMPIHTSTYERLLKARLANGERISTLDQYLSQGEKSTCKLVLEIKPQDTVEQTLYLAQVCKEKLEKHGLLHPDRVMFISFSYDACKWVAQNLPEFDNQYLEGKVDPETVHADGIRGIDYHFIAFHKHPDWVKRAHALGMTVNVWTVDTKVEMRYLIGLGVDVITTNKPLLLREVIEQVKP